MLNSMQAREFFDRHSFIDGITDVIDAHLVGSVFGDEAVIYAISNIQYGKHESYTIKSGEECLYLCLTYTGFLIAVGYYNRQELLNHAKTRRGKQDLKEAGRHAAEDANIIYLDKWRKQV